MQLLNPWNLVKIYWLLGEQCMDNKEMHLMHYFIVESNRIEQIDTNTIITIEDITDEINMMIRMERLSYPDYEAPIGENMLVKGAIKCDHCPAELRLDHRFYYDHRRMRFPEFDETLYRFCSPECITAWHKKNAREDFGNDYDALMKEVNEDVTKKEE